MFGAGPAKVPSARGSTAHRIHRDMHVRARGAKVLSMGADDGAVTYDGLGPQIEVQQPGDG